MPIVGPVVIKFNNTVPLTLNGTWSVDRGVPVTRYYGQGDGTPGSGYLGSAKGTAQSVSGNFEFAIDSAGDEIKTRCLDAQTAQEFFTASWPVGDPLVGRLQAQASDCHWENLSFSVDNPNGRTIITGRLSAGKANFFG